MITLVMGVLVAFPLGLLLLNSLRDVSVGELGFSLSHLTLGNYLPIGSRFTHAAVLQVHKELEEAAWACGAGFWRTLRSIWIPLLVPALVNGALYIAILTTKVMSIAVLLYGPDSMVLSVFLWRVWDTGEPGAASALAVILILALGAMTLIARRLASGSAAFRDV
ncbi:MAG: ABC transporter permease subunit [Desulfobacterales bacterium]|nr:ABC transporter permease subunit [Desulfobacterales bacterium]